MEKPTIYSSAPKPPKQIRVAENPVEPIVEKQDLPEKVEEAASTITVMQPTVSKNNTVVKLNAEKQAASDLPKEEAADSVENEIPENEEVISALPQADLKTVTDFTDNKQIVTVEEPFEEPTAVTDSDIAAKNEIALKESDRNVAIEEPNIVTNDDAKSVAEPTVEIPKSEENVIVEATKVSDVDAKDTAESNIEIKENEPSATVEEAEINDLDAKANEQQVIETKEEDDVPLPVDEQQTVIDVDVNLLEENSLPITEDAALVVVSNDEQDESIESDPETITNGYADIAPEEVVVEPQVEFVTIAEQYSKNDIVEEVKAPIEAKAPSEKNSKSSGSSKQKIDAEYDFENLKIPGDDELFQRQYYTMGEVATMFHANQSQIRFWENEFDILQPKKNKKGDRYFRPEDVKNLQVIHHLLRNRRFTIEGAREYLKSNKQRAQETVSAIASLSQLKSFLTELKANL